MIHCLNRAQPLQSNLEMLSQAEGGVAFLGASGNGSIVMRFDKCNVTGNFVLSSSQVPLHLTV